MLPSVRKDKVKNFMKSQTSTGLVYGHFWRIFSIVNLKELGKAYSASKCEQKGE